MYVSFIAAIHFIFIIPKDPEYLGSTAYIRLTRNKSTTSYLKYLENGKTSECSKNTLRNLLPFLERQFKLQVHSLSTFQRKVKKVKK